MDLPAWITHPTIQFKLMCAVCQNRLVPFAFECCLHGRVRPVFLMVEEDDEVCLEAAAGLLHDAEAGPPNAPLQGQPFVRLGETGHKATRSSSREVRIRVPFFFCSLF